MNRNCLDGVKPYNPPINAAFFSLGWGVYSRLAFIIIATVLLLQSAAFDFD